MPFYEGFVQVGYGIYRWFLDTYCQTNTSASDYGKCYQSHYPPYVNPPFFTYTDTAVPSCVNDGTCIGVLNPPWDYVITLKDNGSVGKQLILFKTWVVVNTNFEPIYTAEKCGAVMVKTNVMDENIWFPFIFRTVNYIGGAGINAYNPLDNSVCALNLFYKPPIGNEIILEWNGATLGMKIIIDINMVSKPNVYYAFYAAAYYAQEASPLAVIPLGYDKEWLPYQELRSAFGFSINGLDQPGWNADDIVRVLRELFPNRAWAVFDDRQYVLYLYNLSPDYVPDWLVEKLSPTAMKVLQPPADATVAKAWLDLLNERNAQIPPQLGLP